MKTYRCLVVDDEELARELLTRHLSQLQQFELVATCASAIEASALLQQETVDLLFLDIEMPVLKGTEFYQHLVNKPKVIFTTAYRDYAVDGFELDAVDYLLKPIVFSRFFNAIEKFLATQTSGSMDVAAEVVVTQVPRHVFVRKDRKQVKIMLSDVRYVKSLKDYIEVHTTTTTHTIKSTLTAFADKLNEGFLRTHRSYLVNLEHITAFTSHDVELGSTEIPIGESYKAVVQKVLHPSVD